MASFYAHSVKDKSKPKSTWQSLQSHLMAVGEFAKERAENACPGNSALSEAALAAGLLHDLGKYRAEFQLHIQGLPVQKEKTYHKQAGAAKAGRARHTPLAYAIAGHHGGMPDSAALKSLVNNPQEFAVVSDIWPKAVNDCAVLQSIRILPPALASLELETFTRFLFSCLVDADWTDTGHFQDLVEGRPPAPKPPELDAHRWFDNVQALIQGKAAGCLDSRMAGIRASILRACLDAAKQPPGLFSLTVPTGGGKTLASLSFALQHAITHAKTHGHRRIVYVSPYLSILDQNARAIREALGFLGPCAEVFEHHSLSEPGGEVDKKSVTDEKDPTNNTTDDESAIRRAENWDAPVILTTNVQFFESLFSNKPSRCRKLHNIARSIILLDECQSLPPELAAPTCAMLRQLADHWGCTILLCTATQPAFNHPELKPEERLTTTEIIPVDLNLFVELKRVEITWPESKDETWTWLQVAERMRIETAALCVVNTRRAARELFKQLRASADIDEVFHLSTSMCPAHRLATLDQIRQRLAAKEKCYVVSTQLIEAGVDVDFPFLMRELGPFEAILQAAGRCNREGLLTSLEGGAGGRVIVFRSQAFVDNPKKYYPDDRWYKAGRDILESNFLAAGRTPSIDDPAIVQEYFTRLYCTGKLDGKGIQAQRESMNFETVAKAYRLICDDSVSLVVASWPSQGSEIDKLLENLRKVPSRTHFRALAPYQVNVKRYELSKFGGNFVQFDPRFDLAVWWGAYDEHLGLGENVDLPVV